jgi:hypothetical protein
LDFVSLQPGTPVHPPQLIDNLSEITYMGGPTRPENSAWVPRTQLNNKTQDLPGGCRKMCETFGPNNAPAKQPDDTGLWQAVSIIDGLPNTSLPIVVIPCAQCNASLIKGALSQPDSGKFLRETARCAADSPLQPREVCSVFPRCAGSGCCLNLQLQMARWFIGTRHRLHFLAAQRSNGFLHFLACPGRLMATDISTYLYCVTARFQDAAAGGDDQSPQ